MTSARRVVQRAAVLALPQILAYVETRWAYCDGLRSRFPALKLSQKSVNMLSALVLLGAWQAGRAGTSTCLPRAWAGRLASALRRMWTRIFEHIQLFA